MEKALKSAKKLHYQKLKKRKKKNVIEELELQVAREKDVYIYNY